MRIVIDAMGGDHAPREVVLGTARAAARSRARLCLVGDEKKIQDILRELPRSKNLEVRHAEEYIRMDETPGTNLRRRDQASMVVGARMIKQGEAEALVCAGNTGALHQVALLEIGRLPGIRRPALAAVFPTSRSPSLALDMGANTDCKPEYLFQFAVMGSIYAEKVLERRNPRVALLNIGTEAGKGNALVGAAYELLSGSALNFVGNVEPTGFFSGDVDVVVCDGFVGNLVLKTSEAVAEWLMDRVRQAARRNTAAKIGGHLLRPSLRSLKQDISHSEHGGAVLLGLKGVVVKCHGRATAETVENGIRVASRALEKNLVSLISSSLHPDHQEGGKREVRT
ncbi:MAG: phosphate acyltransferase PlsX [Armatimonadetes bacterium]|nr:phosphate acyltransferase PlsX [Armatimonadota bacterium]